MNDPHDLRRFVNAQDQVFEAVRAELRDGRKQSHWMWFVFPQLAGLGRSPTARRFGIRSLDEARAYLEHPVLGPRLRECTRLVNAIEGHAIDEIFGYPDDLKFRSSMTLFAQATADNAEFLEALRRHFGGCGDAQTLTRLRESGGIAGTRELG